MSRQHGSRIIVAGIGLALSASALAGCASGGAQPAKTVTVSPSASATSASASSTPTATSASGPATSAPGGRCVTGQLTGSLATPPDGGGAAGSTYVNIVLTNTGSSPCTLQGWPGVSFVGHGNGTQLGAAAVFNRSTPHATVTLAPSGTASALLQVTDAGNEPASCSPLAADGLRVYPPGETASLYIAGGHFTACTSSSIQLLHVNALVAG